MNQLAPFTDDEVQARIKHDFDGFFKKQQKSVLTISQFDKPFSGWWNFAKAFLDKIGKATLVALSPDYESHARLNEVVNETKERIDEIVQLEPDLPKALGRFYDDEAIRILTIHKSKGLEFDSVIIMAVENEIFFGKPESERCAFFVGVSRAKNRLVLTYADKRERPAGHNNRWDVARTPQEEFFNYALPFLETGRG